MEVRGHVQFQNVFIEFSSNSLSVLHISTTSTNRNSQNFSSLNFTFSIICFSETWLDDSIFTSTSLCKLPNYVSKNQVRRQHNKRGVSTYMYKSINLKTNK